MAASSAFAPGWPGSPARWTSSAKSGVGTAIDVESRVWFSLSHGILNEIYFPRVDQACTRDLGLIVTDGASFFSEEKRDAASTIDTVEDGVPAYLIDSRCRTGRYRIEKTVLTDPRRDVLLQQVRFLPRGGAPGSLRLFALLAPHLGNHGSGNTAWVGDYKGVPMLFAEGHGTALALASSRPWRARSAGFVGTSDGWQELEADKELARCHARAENGNVALCGEIDLSAHDMDPTGDADGTFVLALGFGAGPEEAALRARASLEDGFESALIRYVGGWRRWQRRLVPLDRTPSPGRPNAYRVGTAVMRAHEDASFPGALIASLSVPWGFEKGDDDLGGYHLIWPRDLVEAAGGLLAAGEDGYARRVLHYLRATQDREGSWTQNMWLDGRPYWSGVQMDETALPILLVDLARRQDALDEDEVARLWPMVRRAAGFLVRHGPVTGQDRWEEDGGYTPFTLAAEIAALLAAGDLADLAGEPEVATFLRETADSWNSRIESWTFVRDTELARRLEVDGYYVRITPPETADAASPLEGFVPIKNRPAGDANRAPAQIVSPDALALVRFGLRRPDDPRILSTLRVIDALLKVETPLGPCWHRYNDDGYGEHADGAPFDGTGIGRAWPLLTGERAHYELAAGRAGKAEALCRAFESFASDGGLLPEQIWDTDDIPERELYFGRPAGSAMPLVWAHAEHVKLLRSLRDGAVFDLPPQTVQRYQDGPVDPPHHVWRFNNKCRGMPAGKILRLETLAAARVHWSPDGWKTTHDVETRDTGLGLHLADLPTRVMEPGETVLFTFYWKEVGRWEGVDSMVRIDGGAGISANAPR